MSSLARRRLERRGVPVPGAEHHVALLVGAIGIANIMYPAA